MEIKTTLCIGFVSLLMLPLLFAAIIFYKPRSLMKKKATSSSTRPDRLPTPIIGCLPEMLKNKPAFRWIHKLMQELNTEIACIRLGKIHIIPVTSNQRGNSMYPILAKSISSQSLPSPEIAREFLKKQDAIFASRPNSMSAKLTSNGYLTLALSPIGDQWKKMRRVVASEVLSPAMLASMAP